MLVDMSFYSFWQLPIGPLYSQYSRTDNFGSGSVSSKSFRLQRLRLQLRNTAASFCIPASLTVAAVPIQQHRPLQHRRRWRRLRSGFVAAAIAAHLSPRIPIDNYPKNLLHNHIRQALNKHNYSWIFTSSIAVLPTIKIHLFHQ